MLKCNNQLEDSLEKNRQAMKRNQQSRKFNIKNRGVKSRIKNVVRDFQAEPDLAKKVEILGRASSILDKAGQRHIMHPRTAARRKSVMAKQLRRLQDQSKSVS